MSFGSRNCGYCSSIGTIQKTISNNELTCICRKCDKKYTLSLLKIRKKIIYLDQNFLSHSYKKKPIEFVKRYELLRKLARKQLLICPFSDTHDKESHLYSNKDLWHLIKELSRGKRFYLKSKIEERQIISAYSAFLKKKPQVSDLVLSDAIESSVHDWDSSLRISINWSITDFISPQTIRASKDKFTESIINILPDWRASTSSLEDDYKLEVRDHGRFLIRSLELISSKNTEEILESAALGVILFLIHELSEGTIKERVNSVQLFLKSLYFENIPYVNISAGLWAVIKNEIKQKQFLSEKTKKEKIIKETKGIPFDIEHFSVFAPYCEAVFVERKMSRWLEEWKKHQLGNFKPLIFSTSNWDEFDTYLEEIEKNISSEMMEELKIAYD